MRSWLGEDPSAGKRRERTVRRKSEGDGTASSESTVASRPPISAPEATLGAVVQWLRSEDVPGLIIGGIASSLLGRPRLTRDVDILILLEERRWERFLSAGAGFGFLARIDNALAFARRSRVLLVRHQPSGVDIDISLAALPFEEESIAQVRWTKTGKILLPLPTPENLIIMKAVAHRPQDMADIDALLEANPKVNFRRIRRWVKEFSSALGAPDILSDLESLLRRSRTRKRGR
jgi:hypothetical protein